MATLNGAISSTAELIRVTGTPPTPGSYFTVDSEAIRFLGTSRGPQGRKFFRDYWSVDRGVAGTTKATHSNGATLTQYYPDAKATAGGGSISATGLQGGSATGTALQFPGVVTQVDASTIGVAQVVTRLGPFHFAFDSVLDIDDWAMGLADLEPGVTVLTTWAVFDPFFDGPDQAVNIYILVPGGGSLALARYETSGLTFTTPTSWEAEPFAYTASPAAYRGLHGPIVTPLVDVKLAVAYIVPAPDLTQGACDVYAMIATPAA